MLPENPLITRQGFEYILSILDKGYSKRTLEQMLNSVMQLPKEPTEKNGVTKQMSFQKTRKVQMRIKREQIIGVINLVGYLEPFERVLEVGCGKGLLAKELALFYPGVNIVGIDSNNLLIEKLRQANQFPNLSFEARDAFGYMPEGIDLVLSLHGCGNLTDRVIDIATSNKSAVICVPCCYGKIKRNEKQEGTCFLPRSLVLKGQEEIFRNRILRHTRKLEGIVSEKDNTIQSVVRDTYRLLVNFDRLFYLKEKGYAVYVAKITEAKTKPVDGKSHWNSSLRYAIVGVNIL